MKEKYILQFKMYRKDCYVIADINSHLVKFETESGLKFEPTGLKNDYFGISYLRNNVKENRIFNSLQDLRKHVRFMHKCGIEDLVNFESSINI